MDPKLQRLTNIVWIAFAVVAACYMAYSTYDGIRNRRRIDDATTALHDRLNKPHIVPTPNTLN